MIAWIVGGDGRTTPWSLHLGMPIQTNDPVIQIVDGDEERIRLGAQPQIELAKKQAMGMSIGLLESFMIFGLVQLFP